MFSMSKLCFPRSDTHKMFNPLTLVKLSLSSLNCGTRLLFTILFSLHTYELSGSQKVRRHHASEKQVTERIIHVKPIHPVISLPGVVTMKDTIIIMFCISKNYKKLNIDKQYINKEFCMCLCKLLNSMFNTKVCNI